MNHKRLVLSAMALSMVSTELSSESVTLTTYYPAPSGVYTRLISTGEAWLGRNGAGVMIGASSAPGATLDIKPSGSLPQWLRVGNGGDSGVLFLDYGPQSAPRLVMSDSNDAARLEFQQLGNGTELAPQYSSWIGMAKRNSPDVAIMGGRVGIGVLDPTSTLDINGDLKIRGGAPGNGKVLTSDDYGLSSWQPAIKCGWEGTKCHCKDDGGSIEGYVIIGIECLNGSLTDVQVKGLSVTSGNASCPSSKNGCDFYSRN